MSRDEEFEKLKSEFIDFKHQIEMRTTEHELQTHKQVSGYESKINRQVSNFKILISGGLATGLFAIILVVLAVFLPDFFNL